MKKITCTTALITSIFVFGFPLTNSVHAAQMSPLSNVTNSATPQNGGYFCYEDGCDGDYQNQGVKNGYIPCSTNQIEPQPAVAIYDNKHNFIGQLHLYISPGDHGVGSGCESFWGGIDISNTKNITVSNMVGSVEDGEQNPTFWDNSGPTEKTSLTPGHWTSTVMDEFIHGSNTYYNVKVAGIDHIGSSQGTFSQEINIKL